MMPYVLISIVCAVVLADTGVCAAQRVSGVALSPRLTLSGLDFTQPLRVAENQLIRQPRNTVPITTVILDVNGTLYEKERAMKLFIRISRALWLARHQLQNNESTAVPPGESDREKRIKRIISRFVAARYDKSRPEITDETVRFWQDNELLPDFARIVELSTLTESMIAAGLALFVRLHQTKADVTDELQGLSPTGQQVALRTGISPELWEAWKNVDIPVHKTLRPDKALAQTLRKLRNQGIALYIVTNAKTENAHAIFRALGIDGIDFAAILTRDVLGARKPVSCATAVSYLRKQGIDVGGVVSVGDSAPDVTGALAHGMMAFNLTDINALYRIDTVIAEHNQALACGEQGAAVTVWFDADRQQVVSVVPRTSRAQAVVHSL